MSLLLTAPLIPGLESRDEVVSQEEECAVVERLEVEGRVALAPATGRLDPKQQAELARLLELVLTPQ